MKIAIASDGNFVSAHFGRCQTFTIIEIQDGRLIDRMPFANPGRHPGYLPKFLRKKGVKTIVAGGMGRRALGFFVEESIEVVVGVKGTLSNVIDNLAAGTLEARESLCQQGAGG